jgi:Pentapeptide repeats (8 copies)
LCPDSNHAEILRSGPAAWNAWRETNPTTVPDLAGVALKFSQRQMGPSNGGPINLSSARLHNAVFRFAILSAARLELADMSGAIRPTSAARI